MGWLIMQCLACMDDWDDWHESRRGKVIWFSCKIDKRLRRIWRRIIDHRSRRNDTYNEQLRKEKPLHDDAARILPPM